MAKRELTCIICPKGCALKVELDENGKVLGGDGQHLQTWCGVRRKRMYKPHAYSHINDALFGRNGYSGENKNSDTESKYLRMYEYNKQRCCNTAGSYRQYCYCRCFRK